MMSTKKSMNDDRRTKARAASAGIATAEVALYVALVSTFKDPILAGWLVPMIAVFCICASVWLRADRKLVKRRGIIFTIVSTSAVVVSLVGPLRLAEWRASARFDGTYPATDCANKTAVDVENWNVYKSGSQDVIAHVQSIYSPECKTTWVRARTTLRDGTVVKILRRPAQFLLAAANPKPVSDKSTEWTYGTQVFDAGCIEVQVLITVANHTVGTAPTRQICESTS
jgi:hypothetical protein